MDGFVGILLAVALIAGGIFAVVYLRPQMLSHVREMKFMTSSTIRDLQDMFGMMQADGLGDAFRNYVEIKGVVHCDQAVRTPFSAKEVAYCSSRLSAVTQREERYKDSDGNVRTRIIKDEDLLSSEDSSDVLVLRDDSSDVRVTLDIKNGCSFDIPETFDRVETVGNLGRYTYFRNFQSHRPNLLGYRMREKTISLNQPLYVLGEAYKEGNTIHIGKPVDKDKSFIVSTKSEDELVGKYEGNAKIALFGGIAAVVIGVALLVYRLM